MADRIQATPRSPILGLFSDIVNLPLQYMSSPERTQQLQGAAQFLYGTGVPQTLERLSYGEPLTTGSGGLGGTTRLRPETADAVLNVAPFAPVAGKAGRVVGRMAGEEINAAMSGQPTRSLLGAMTPQPMRIIEKNPTPFVVKHGTNQPFDEFKSGMGVTAKHIYTTPEEYAKDAAKYGETLITAQASPKSLIDFSSEEKLDKPTINALKKAAKDAGITDQYYPFESFMDDLMSGQLYQKGGGSRTQDALLSELFSKYQAVKMPDAAVGGGVSKSVVFENPSLLKILPENSSATSLPVEQSINDLSYRGSHTAPSSEFGAPLHDLTGGGQMYPADVYSAKAAQYYGTGNKKADIEAFNLVKQVRGNPDAEVTMYRAVPKNTDITNINAGDWVTLSKDYAKNHGESVLNGDYKILSKKVKAKELWTNADSIHEFGYQPESLTQQSPTPIANPTYTDPFGNTIDSSIR